MDPKRESPVREAAIWLRHADVHNLTRTPRRGTFFSWFPGTATKKARGRTTLFSGLENKFLKWFGSARVAALAIFGLVASLSAEVEAAFVLISERSAGGGEQLDGHSAGNKSQEA